MNGTDRRCICGTVLARDNPGPLCSPCERAGARLRLTGERGPLAVRLGRRLAEVYSAYRESESRASYLADLTPLLDGLCELFGMRPPRFEGVDKPVRECR